MKREKEMRLEHTCLFCREPLPSSKEDGDNLEMKKIEANDPFAMCQKGSKEQQQGNNRTAFEYFAKAAELGDAWAHYRLAGLYCFGLGVEKKEGKMMYHLEEAAIGGHPQARYKLGDEEWNFGNYERAVKHWIIAATQGHDGAIKQLLEAFKKEYLGKEAAWMQQRVPRGRWPRCTFEMSGMNEGSKLVKRGQRCVLLQRRTIRCKVDS